MDYKTIKEDLYKLYVEDFKSLSDIAAKYNASTMTIRAWLHKNGIPTRTSTQDIYKELKSTEFSFSQKSLIIGSLLGDGCLTIGRDSRNARFVERHSSEQLDYLVWKRNMLKPFTTSNISKTESKEHSISGVACCTKDSYCFSTITHSYLTNLHNIFYRDGKKVVPSNLDNMINGLVISIWICDDGCFTYDAKRGIYRLDLHTESFTYNENIYLCREVLSKFFECPFRINSRMYLSGKAYYICLSGKSKLINLVDKIKEFIPECMLYKFKNYIS
jgi:hypothetical protein